ncbi:MAG: hypothetical protein MR210_04895 [Erysipelotrichaceae bacterium]|nr:hypothetical protein [Erysipelotrichaceae bacterium]MDY5252907.1 hypothetical protein [Erysipelotrichaceae bacterium]
MKITKKHLDDIKRCYCASNIHFDGENHLILASEDPNVLCAMYSGKDFTNKEIIWQDAGGCMSIIPIPNREKEFLAVQEFYLKVSDSKAKIVWGHYGENGWEIKDILHLPFIHRFDIYHKNGINYFIGATIATSKKDKNDWSVPGRIYVGELSDDLEQPLKIEVLLDGLYRNHGYWRDKDENGDDIGYFASDQGIIKVVPPAYNGGQWQSELVMDGNVGEIALVDIDGDGVKEIMTIEPFHGSMIKIYHRKGHSYECVWEYDNEIEFAHTLVGCKLRNIPSFVAGIRRKDAELMYVQYVDGKYVANVIEQGVGPANVCVVNENDRDLIVAANHTNNEAAVYIVED